MRTNPTVPFPPGPDELPLEAPQRVLKVRVKKVFRYRPERRGRRGIAVAIGECRDTVVGEVLVDVPEVDARGWALLGRVEIVE